MLQSLEPLVRSIAVFLRQVALDVSVLVDRAALMNQFFAKFIAECFDNSRAAVGDEDDFDREFEISSFEVGKEFTVIPQTGSLNSPDCENFVSFPL